MHLFRIPAAQAVPALRALKTVAMAGGVFAEAERALLQVAAGLYGVDEDLDALRPISPLDLAQSITAYEDRLRLLQASMVMALADGEATAEEWKVLTEMRAALEVEEARMAAFEKLASGRRELARAEAERRAAAPSHARAPESGLRKVLRYFGASVGASSADPALAWRYRKLGLLDEGTLGRALWRHCTERELSFPGEAGGPPDAVIRHDAIHVLTGYATDARGRLLAAAFTAAMKREEAFAFVFFPMLELSQGDFDPEAFVAALERGAQCTVDLAEPSWDLWAAAPRPLRELRVEYAIGEG
jgi:hypothetical protein